MKAATVRDERMARQRLVGEPYADVTAAVGHLTAVQSQEFDDALWSLSRRTAGSPIGADIAEEVAGGRIVRHHVLRPTWHFVLVDDLDWLLDLTAARIAATMRPQLRSTGLFDDRDRLVAFVGQIVEAADAPLTRREIGERLTEQGIELKGQALGHLTMSAELDKVVTTGPRRGSWDTFVPYAARIPTVALDRDEAVARLASRYLGSHGPATPQDFAWWSGLTLTDAKAGFAANDTVELSDGLLDLADPPTREGPAADPRTQLLSLFDEYVIAYKDRTIYAAPVAAGGTIDVWGGNLVVVDGVVAGTWKTRRPRRTTDPILIEVTTSRSLSTDERFGVEADSARLAACLDVPCELLWKDGNR